MGGHSVCIIIMSVFFEVPVMNCRGQFHGLSSKHLSVAVGVHIHTTTTVYIYIPVVLLTLCSLDRLAHVAGCE